MANHSVYIVFGDDQSDTPIASLQGTTTHPALSKDIASFSCNDSVPKVIKVVLDSLKFSSDYKKIKTTLKKAPPSRLVVFACGLNDFDLNVKAVKDTVKDSYIFGEKFHENADVTSFLGGAPKRKESHAFFYTKILSDSFEHKFKSAEVYKDKDLAIKCAINKIEMLGLEKGQPFDLWHETTYSALHLFKSDEDIEDFTYRMPDQFKQLGNCGGFDLGERFISLIKSHLGNSEIDVLDRTMPLFVYKNFLTEYIRLGDIDVQKIPLDADGIVHRVTKTKRIEIEPKVIPMGFVNVGDFVMELIDEELLDTGASRDESFSKAVASAKKLAKNKFGDEKWNNLFQEASGIRRGVKEDAIIKYILHVGLGEEKSGLDSGTRYGVVFGETSGAILDDDIDMPGYISDHEFMDKAYDYFSKMPAPQDAERARLERTSAASGTPQFRHCHSKEEFQAWANHRFSQERHRLLFLNQKTELLPFIHNVGRKWSPEK
ncbi:hypothetical protein [Endozoicomonas sp. Mp262]|uniref:hypothetical protein n=1 Tax=Endozoicomonas sp. Mp262 TaxID=2919499 RepID=UPI0021D8C536